VKLSKKISFAAFCADILGEPISPAWITVFKAFEGQPLRDAELEIWHSLSGQEDYTPQVRGELWCVKGRRAAGTKTAAKFVTYRIHAHGHEFRRFAAKSDRLHALIVLQTRDVAKEVMAYFNGFYTDSPLLSGEVAEIFKNSIELKNGFVVSIATCSFRAPRGLNIPIGLLDETGAWRTEGTDLDVEVYRSLRPAMVQFKNSKLIGLGSPWVRAGLLFDCWQNRFDRSDRLVLCTPTPAMNPLIDPEELAREQANDPSNFRREFLAEFLDDIDSFLPDCDINSAVRSGVRERAPAMAFKGAYVGAIDASGLTGKDRFVLGIAHRTRKASSENISIEFDLLRGWSRAPVGAVCDEVAAILKSYFLTSVVADQFGFSFLKELLAQRGISVIQRSFTSRSKPEILLDLKLGLAQGRISLLDHAESLRELRMLESRRTSGGNYSIAGPRNAHDDYAITISLLSHEMKGGNSGVGFLICDGQVISNGSQPVWTDPRFFKTPRRHF
jgi:hypothetical protein